MGDAEAVAVPMHINIGSDSHNVDVCWVIRYVPFERQLFEPALQLALPLHFHTHEPSGLAVIVVGAVNTLPALGACN